jgi:hypothetical protein
VDIQVEFNPQLTKGSSDLALRMAAVAFDAIDEYAIKNKGKKAEL